MLVEEYLLGNTKIKIFDDAYVGKTSSDINKILKRIENLGYEAFKNKKQLLNKG